MSHQLLLILLFFGCSKTKNIAHIPSNWKKINITSSFSFYVPTSMVEKKVQPIDSKFGVFISDSCMLVYDYGSFTEEPLHGSEYLHFQQEKVEIDGKQAIIIQYTDKISNQELPYAIAVEFTKNQEGDSLKMSMRCANKEHLEKAKQIFRTIKF